MTGIGQPHRPSRDLRIDLFRGAALVFIFWDHVPGSVMGLLTPRNVGLSDAAEIFVLLAGWAAMLAYGGAYLRSGFYVMAMRALKRVGQLYVAHVFLLAVLMGVVFVANQRVETRDFVTEAGLGYFLQQPQQALIAGLLLTFKPMMMDPLPLYIVLVLIVPVVVPGLLRRPVPVLAISFALWLLATVTHVNLPARPNGTWFFNPLAWQFLFVLGAYFASTSLRQGTRPTAPAFDSRRLLPWSVAFLGISALLALSWRWPALHDLLVPRWVGDAIYPVSKTDLAPLRLLHILALGVCAWHFVPQGGWLETPLPRALALMGRHSLHVFCAGVLLTPVADAINALSGDRAIVQVATGLGGAIAMAFVATVIEEYRRLGEPRRPAAVVEQPAVVGRLG